MVDFKEFIKPTKFKIIMFLVLLVPSFYISYIFLAITFRNMPLLFILGFLISYGIGSILDYSIKNNTVKIIMASIVGFVSLVLAYIAYKMYSEPMICDPVHIPTECETACREIIQGVTNRTAEINQKFQECMQNCIK